MTASNSAAPQAPRKVRAIVFSNFPGQYFHQKLLPKLERCNIDVVKVVEGRRITPSIDCSNVDILIGMADILTNTQRLEVRELSRKTGIRYVGLTKHVNWQEHLAITPTTQANVVPIRSSKSSGYTAEELESLNAALEKVPALPEPPPVKADDLQELLELFETENRELSDSKCALAETLKVREDHILTLIGKSEKLEREKLELEGRVKEQTRIRGEVEAELRDAKAALDALARQLQSERSATRAAPTAPPPAPAPQEALPSAGSAAAYKSNITRLKNDLTVSQMAQVALSKELETLRVRFAELQKSKGGEVKEVVLNKDDLMLWGAAIRDVVTGNPTGYRALLELASQYEIDIKSLLSQLA